MIPAVPWNFAAFDPYEVNIGILKSLDYGLNHYTSEVAT